MQDQRSPFAGFTQYRLTAALLAPDLEIKGSWTSTRTMSRSGKSWVIASVAKAGDSFSNMSKKPGLLTTYISKEARPRPMKHMVGRAKGLRVAPSD